MKILIAAAVLFISTFSFSQSISPVIVETSKKYNGQITVTNPGIAPMAVTVEAYSFSLSPEGGTLVRPLDPAVHLKLDAMSARISPKDSYVFGYRAVCGEPPCNVILKVGMVIGQTKEGLLVRVIVPQVVYMDAKAKGARARARAAAGLKD